MPDTDASLNRLRWQCRRGMLELDVILRRFIDHTWADIDATMKEEFELLLRYSDQQLQEWLADGKEADREVRQIVSKIRQTDYHSSP